MKVTFVGQLSVLGTSPTEKRIRALLASTRKRGYETMAFSATEKIKNINGATIKYRPSFSPQSRGGWLYTILSLLSATRSGADTIHLTTWRAGALAWLAATLRPTATIVWTISTMPRAGSLLSRFVIWQAARACDAITVPTRSLQYLLRLHFNLLAAYIPDGYEAPITPDIPAKTWNVRKGLYTVAITTSSADRRRILKAYKATGTHKKILVFKENELSERQLSSLVRQAAVVVLFDSGTRSSVLLQAMDAGKPIVAVNEPLYAEVLGTAGKVLRRSDAKYLRELLTDIVKNPSIQKELGVQAQKRSQAHFSWTRISDEYDKLYHYPLVRRVPVDSIQRSRLTDPAVY
ncbi:MAG: glycosyltransferase family 4 protein [Candidatus Andersenbacteria bacterium]|nr:glycosyltransferase family 4 protein [Candidatus Andersenbacteria bacterium]MBI3250663.1 glycosyltransferase family 4 protein [Candidatus Andersenbacteria bacterium]